MTTDAPSTDVQTRLTSGELILAPARLGHMASTHGMLSTQLWLRGEIGAMHIEERPSGWNGQATWWLPECERRAGLLRLLADLMPWLPPALAAPRKLQVADCMPYPARPESATGNGKWGKWDKWDRNSPDARRPFVDAVFVDDAAHLHLVDVVSVGGDDAMRALNGWHVDLKLRGLERHWWHRAMSSSPFEAEYDKLCWMRDQSPLAGICWLVESIGDEIPYTTAEALWNWVGRRCRTYWSGDVPYERQESPHCVLITDGTTPSNEQLLELGLHGNETLACVTPFVLDGATWLRVDVRAWCHPRGALAESALPAPNRICRMAGATDVGKRRTANQDALLCSEEEGWAAVADGMGGHPNGDVASATALRVFDEAMRQWPCAQTLHARRYVAQRLRQAAVLANAELWKENDGAGIFKRMGTTLCALRLHGDQLSIVHAGDSRIYEVTPGGLYQKPELRRLTQDHGEGGGLDRALGLWERVPIDMDTLPITHGGLYLLCTDGLTNMVDDGEILNLCLRHTHGDSDLEGLVDALIDAANEAGGADNITVCVVEANERRDQATER